MFAARQKITHESQIVFTICVKKVDFVAFIATVINCTAQVSKKSKKLDIIVAAAEKSLGFKDLTSKDLQGLLAPEDPTSQVPLEVPPRSDLFYLFFSDRKVV